MELIPIEPPLYAYVIVSFCALQKDLQEHGYLHTVGIIYTNKFNQ